MRWLILILTFNLASHVIGRLTDEEQKEQREWLANPPPFDLERFKYFTGDAKDDMVHFEKVLDEILIPRPPESKGIETVRGVIVRELKRLGWDVQIDTFYDKTPIKPSMRFDNIIATFNPKARRRLILSCHYDSKNKPPGFLGAMDSAVSCAQLISIAKALNEELEALSDDQVTLQLVFFDGEEALVEWQGKDNTYGSRHLSGLWSNQDVLDEIDIIVLLDLLGMANPGIRSMDPKTHRWYEKLVEYAKILFGEDNKVFPSTYGEGRGIQDDHISFYEKGVPILHLIDSNFLGSGVWHTMDDNRKNIDFETAKKLMKLLKAFVADYLGLNKKP